jgi:hypothetical protein
MSLRLRRKPIKTADGYCYPYCDPRDLTRGRWQHAAGGLSWPLAGLPGFRTRDLLTPGRYTVDSRCRRVTHHVVSTQVIRDAMQLAATVATPRNSSILRRILRRPRSSPEARVLRDRLVRGTCGLTQLPRSHEWSRCRRNEHRERHRRCQRKSAGHLRTGPNSFRRSEGRADDGGSLDGLIAGAHRDAKGCR